MRQYLQDKEDPVDQRLWNEQVNYESVPSSSTRNISDGNGGSKEAGGPEMKRLRTRYPWYVDQHAVREGCQA